MLQYSPVVLVVIVGTKGALEQLVMGIATSSRAKSLPP